jgi:hypothetical protein
VLELCQIGADWSTVPQSRAIQAAENKRGPDLVEAAPPISILAHGIERELLVVHSCSTA